MDCVVLAGGIPAPDDPLYGYAKGRPKSLLKIGDRPMFAYVVDALQASSQTGRILVVGLEDGAGWQFANPVEYMSDRGSLLANAFAGAYWHLEKNPDHPALLFCTADIPLITGQIVDDFVDCCRPFDCAIYYNFVTEAAMEARFPGSQRTYIQLGGHRVAGGDMAILHATLVHENQDLYHALTEGRKHAWKMARAVGLRTLLKLLFRRLSLQELEATAERLIGRPTRAILSPHAELAMDGDKPRQIELFRAELARIA